MGTRSTYRIIEQHTTGKKVKKIKEKPICLLYLQYDGYPTGHPLEIAEWLSKSNVVNGFGRVEEDEVIFNGAGCLAAQLVHKLKNGTGGTYLHTLSSRGNCGEDYLYDIIVKENRTIEFVCYDNWEDGKPELFRGTPSEFVQKYQKVDA